MKNEVLQKVIEILSKICNFNNLRIQPEYRLREDLGATDVDIRTAMDEIEDEFNITIPHNVTPIKTVSDVINLIHAELCSTPTNTAKQDPDSDKPVICWRR